MNIIFINSDTFRYDNLFDRAEMPVRTPCLDAFAERAVSFSRFYAASFPTIPERTDFESGRYGWPFYGWQDLAKSTTNRLTHMLQAGGYVSQLICDCPHLFNTGFQHMFTAATAVRGQEGDLAFLRMNYPIEEQMPPEKTRTGHHFQGRNLVDLHRWHNANWRLEEDTFPPRTAKLAVEWLEENYRHDPFFLWLDFFDPHEPWDPPEYMVRKYDPDYDGTPILHPNYGKASDLTPEELRNLKAHYAAESELVDRWVGRVLQKIDDLSLWDNSIVIFTTDHGHSIGEHNRTGKSNINERDDRFWPLYPEVAQIPFMIAAPGIDGGRELDIFCQPVDTLPTLLDMVGIEADPPEPMHGRSFAPHLLGESAPPLRDFAICGCRLGARDGKIAPESVTPVLYTAEWAYAPIGPEGEPELFALAEDPYAESNIADRHPDVVKELHRLLTGWMKDIGADDATIALLGTV